ELRQRLHVLPRKRAVLIPRRPLAEFALRQFPDRRDELALRVVQGWEHGGLLVLGARRVCPGAMRPQRYARAFAGEAQGFVISFATIDLLWKVIAPKRWEILRLI